MGNSTTVFKSIVASGEQLCIEFDEEERLINPLIEYRLRSNKFVPRWVVEGEVFKSILSEADEETFWTAVKGFPMSVNDLAQSFATYSELLQSYLANPSAWGLYPIIDSLCFTVDANSIELKKLDEYIKSPECKKIFKVENHYRRNKYDLEDQIKNFYKNRLRLTWRNSSASIYISYGLNSSGTGQRPVRISFNPSRFTRIQLKKVFKTIKNSGVFNDYKMTVEDANLTRLDLAFDLIGIPTPLVILSKAGVENYSFFPKIQIDDDEILAQTVRAGIATSNTTMIYSKMQKILNLNQKHLALIVDKSKQPIHLARFERGLKPQAYGNPMKLVELANAPYMLAQTKIYSSLAIKQFGSNVQQDILRIGYMPWAEQHSAGLSAHKEALKRYEVFVNHAWFKSQQERVLRNLLKCIALDS